MVIAILQVIRSRTGSQWRAFRRPVVDVLYVAEQTILAKGLDALYSVQSGLSDSIKYGITVV